MTSKQLKDFKSKREPIKVNISEVSEKGGGGTHVGTHVVYMRDVQTQETRSWVPLLHAKPSLRPEIEVSHRIVDKAVLLNPPSNATAPKKPIKRYPKNPAMKPPKQEQDKNNKPKNSNAPKPPKPHSEYDSDFESESGSGSRSGSDLDLGSDLGSEFDSETETRKKPHTTKKVSSLSPSSHHSSHSSPSSHSPTRSSPPSPPTPPQLPKTEMGGIFQEDPDLNDRSLDIAFHEYQDKQGVSSQKERLRQNEASHFVHEIVNPPSPSKDATKPSVLPTAPQPTNYSEIPNFNKINITQNKENNYTQPTTNNNSNIANNFANNFVNNKNSPPNFGTNNAPLYEDIDVARDSPEYAAALMLAKWREKEKEQFYKNLKVKETNLMDKLKSYWGERERQIKTTILQRDKEISTIASHIQQTLTRVQDKEELAIKKEEQVHSMRENLQKLYNSKMVEVQIICQRLMDDHSARLELEKVKMHELETGEKILRDRLAAIERRLHIADDEFLETRRKSDNVPVAKLQTEITQNKQQINDMHQELQKFEKETNDNKENLLKIYKEIARVKREYTDEVEKQMKKEQQELSELRKQFQPTLAFS